jgi:hypothetical protein
LGNTWISGIEQDIKAADSNLSMTMTSGGPTTLTPYGYQRTPSAGVGELRRQDGGWVAGGEPLADPPGPDDVARLRGLRGLAVRWPYEDGRQEMIGLLAGLAAAGVPLTADTVPPWLERADPGLAGLLRSWPDDEEKRQGGEPAATQAHTDAGAAGGARRDGGAAAGPDRAAGRSVADLRREEHSVRLRRHAWRHRAAHDTPVSVVLTTRRPHYVAGALRQIARQRHAHLEVVLALHGFPADRVRDPVAAFPHPISVIEADATAVFGAVLDQAARRASGDLIAKWDDDDWYGPDHLTDLLLARAYSGADVVGTAAEFFYLQPLDVTVRRTDYTSEVWSDHVAGGTILLGRSTYLEAGGFQPLPRGVDSALLKTVHAAGGRIYRTHGLGYMLRRAGADEHTWRRPLAHFLRVATNQWRGFRPSRIMEVEDLSGERT